MKIVHKLKHGTLGGTETHALAMGLAQAEAGHDVAILICGKRGPISDLMESKGLRVYYADGKSDLNIGAVLRARKLLKQLDPDVIHSHGIERLPFISLRGLKALRINTIHCAPSDSLQGTLLKKSLTFINRWLVRYVDGFISVAADVRDRYLKRGFFTSSPWRVVLNGVDASKFYPADDTALPSKESNQPIELLMVTRMEPEKHPDDAIRILALLRNDHALNAKLTFCGEGDSLQECKDLTEELGMSEFVTFAGRRNDIDAFTRRSHGTFILSSANYEACPQVPIEGICCGCPVFSYRVPGGLHEWFKEEGCGGVISKERTPESLVEKIVPVLTDENRWEQIRKEALETAKDFSAKIMAEKTVAYYRELLS